MRPSRVNPPFRSRAIPADELRVGAYVAVYGPNFHTTDIGDYQQGDDIPDISPTTQITFKIAPTERRLMGFPLRINAINLPFVLCSPLSIDGVPTGGIIIDYRFSLLSPVSNHWVAAFMATARPAVAAAIRNGQLPPSHHSPSPVISTFIPFKD